MYDKVDIFDMIATYFGNSMWLLLFLLSFFYIFLNLTMRSKRAVVGAVIAFFLFFNNITFAMFTEKGEGAVYYRHLWIVPVMIVIGIAVVTFFKGLPCSKRIFVGMCLVLVLSVKDFPMAVYLL